MQVNFPVSFGGFLYKIARFVVVNAIAMRSRGGGAGSIEALRLHAAMCVVSEVSDQKLGALSY
jgi:hypothetical protein